MRRRGKYLLIDLTDRSHILLVHLGMSGRFRLVAAAAPRAPHTHVVFSLDDGRQLRYSDPRRFGLVTLAPGGGREREHPALALLGRDPLEDSVSGADLHARASHSRQAVKQLLLDQRVVAGVGNIYASEALWLARIPPTLPGRRLSRTRAAALARAIRAVLARALDRGGTSLRDFVDADGREGENAHYLRVYGREGEPCLRRGCPGRIRRRVIQGRATFYCPRCQDR